MSKKTAGTGYSGTPLVKKLGIREGDRVALVDTPADYRKLIGSFPSDVEIVGPRSRQLNFLHYFVDKESDLRTRLPRFRSRITQDGMIWVSWPKKSSGVKTDITEDVVRKHAFANKLVDVKVCAVDETWSGLKLVIRKKDRH